MSQYLDFIWKEKSYEAADGGPGKMTVRIEGDLLELIFKDGEVSPVSFKKKMKFTQNLSASQLAALDFSYDLYIFHGSSATGGEEKVCVEGEGGLRKEGVVACCDFFN